MKQQAVFLSLVTFGLILAVASLTPAPLQALTVGTPYKVVDKALGSSHGLHSHSMIYADGVYAITIIDTDSGPSRIKVVFVDANNPGAPIGIYQVSNDAGGIQGNPRVAFDANRGKFGVVWVRYDATGTTSVLEFAWVKKTGEKSSPVVISNSFPYRPDGPDIVWDSAYDRYAVVFGYYQPGVANWDLRLLTMDNAGNVLGWMAAPIQTMPEWEAALWQLPQFGGPNASGPTIAADANGYGIAYTYSSNRYIHYVYIKKSDLTIQTGPVQVSESTLNLIPHINFNSTNNEFGAAWQWSDLVSSGKLYFARLGPSGLIDRKVLASAFDVHSGDLWWDGGRYVLGWYEAPAGGQWNLKAATCSSTGVLDGTSVIVQSIGGDQVHVAARGADNYFIQWRLSYEDVWGATATNSNTLIASASPTEGGVVTKNPDKSVYDMGENVQITATPASTDWQFTGWSGDASGTENPKTITMDRAKNVVANFYNTSWPTLTITLAPAGGGSTTINGKSATSTQAAPGSQLALVATANTGYIFNSWRDAGGQVLSTNRAYTYSMPAGSVTLTAAFDLAYSVATSANPTNGGTVAPTGALWYAAGSVIAFTATPAANYSFTAWNVNGTSAGNANPINITIDSNKVIYADFTYGGGGTTYTLSTNISPAGTGTVTPNYGVYAAGSVVSVRATSADGYSFDYWTGSVTGSTNPINVTMDANKSVTAVFKEGAADDAPAISNLAQKSSIKSSRATFSLDYSDANGDLSGGRIRVSYKYKSNGRTYRQSVAIPAKVKSITGTTTGTIEWENRFKKYSTRYKSFEMTVYLVDAAGGEGNSQTITAKKSLSKKKPSAGGGGWGE
ncbi:MAG: hypothetical protein AB1714_16520 [Acidobacteriota bacterium]